MIAYSRYTKAQSSMRVNQFSFTISPGSQVMLEPKLLIIGQRPERARLLFVRRRPLCVKHDEVVVAVYARSLKWGRH